MTAILHVGSVKTGSTSLQNFLFSNNEILRKHGFIYPSSYVNSGEHKGNGIFLRRGLSGRDFDTMKRSTDLPHFIFSDEGLFSDFRYVVDDCFGSTDFLVVAYIRNPVDLICSWAAELMKPYNVHNGGIIKLESAIKLCTDRYENILNGFIDSCDAVGWSNVVIRSSEKENLYNSDIISDFFTSLPIFTEINKFNLLTSCDNIMNKSPDYKYCYLSENVYERLRKIDRLDLYNERSISISYNFCKTGNSYRIRDTISQREFESINKRFAGYYSDIMQKSGNSDIKYGAFERSQASDSSNFNKPDSVEIDTFVLLMLAASRLAIDLDCIINDNGQIDMKNLSISLDSSIALHRKQMENLQDLGREIIKMHNDLIIVQSYAQALES